MANSVDQYIVGFVPFMITNKCLSNFMYSSETNIVFKSCDTYALNKNSLFCDLYILKI